MATSAPPGPVAWRAFIQSPGPIVLVLVVLAAVAAVVFSAQRWVRAVAVAVPIVMMLGVLAVTPAALEDKRSSQFTATPQCLTGVQDASGDSEDGKDEGGLWLAAAEDSQRAFDSIEHVGLFGGGSTVGVGGCSLGLTQVGDVDFMGHYRSALPQAGWRVVEDDGDRIRAERAGMAFEVRDCAEGGGVWAGRAAEIAVDLCPEG